MKQHTYYVKGMHCASCEIIIEKKLLELENIKSADASTGSGQVAIMCEGQAPNPDRLSSLFKDDGYTFSNEQKKQPAQEYDITSLFTILIFGGIAYFLLRAFGITDSLRGLANVTASSSLPSFFVFGLLAGVSSCAALVGGIVLSMSKEWSAVYNQENSFYKKLQPHILFNIGRILSYGFFGAMLGDLGAKIRLSVGFSSLLVIVLGIIMLVFGLQMLGVRAFQKFQIAMPKFITRRIADPKKFNGRHLPFLLGAGTFFLPCGFTITAQGMALLSGNALQGGLIMAVFALGTLPMLFGIGVASAKLFNKPHLSATFQKVAGVILIIFAAYNINAQMTVLNLPNFSSLQGNGNAQVDKTLPQIIDGKQIVKMTASARGYNPNYIKVRAGIPVRWEIRDVGTSGCTNAIIARGLFSGQIDLVRGQTSVKEFIPPAPGRYRFSCWMGMISGTIEVVN